MTCQGELGAVERAMFFLNSHVAAGEDRANTSKAQARKTLNKMSKFQALVEGQNRIVLGERVHFVKLVSFKLMRYQLAITAAVSGSECTLSEVKCRLDDGYPDELSPDAPDRSAAVGLITTRSCSFYGLFIFLSFSSCCSFLS